METMCSLLANVAMESSAEHGQSAGASCSLTSDSAASSASASPTGSTKGAAISLLDRLRAPKASEVGRKRKVQENPSNGKRRQAPRGALTDPKSVIPEFVSSPPKC